MAHGEGLITMATRVAHQSALEDHLRTKENLSRFGVCVDDFTLMERYPLADFNSALERARES
jgi:hypothetical protein